MKRPKQLSLETLCSLLAPQPRVVRNSAAASEVCAVPAGIETELASYRLGGSVPEGITARIEDVESPAINDACARQSYQLKIEKEGITVCAPSDLGLLYGIQTVRQLIALGDGTTLPAGTVTDRPALAVRGLMIDISRDRVPTRETLLRYVDLMLLLKMNQFQLYTEHTFAYTEHRRVWEGWSPVTAEDIRWLNAEAAARGIELVPNQNSFGHLRWWLSHSEYSHLAETPDGFVTPWGQTFPFPFSLAPAVPETRMFLARLYDELLPNFQSNLFNVGCDETFDLGQGRSKEACETRGTGEVYLEFLQDIHDLVSERGKRMVFYGDILKNHPEVIERVPKEAVVVEWWYEAENDFDLHCSRLRNTGLEFIVAPGTSSWNSITGRFDNAAANVRAAVRAAVKYDALGTLMTDWGDNGHLQPFPVALPPITLAASLSWNPDTSEGDPFVFLGAVGIGLGSSELGTALRRLGRMGSLLGPDAHNNNLFGLSLVNFDVDEYHRQLTTQEYDETGVRAELAAVRDLAFKSEEDPAAESPNPHLVRDEIVLAADLAEFALDLVPLHRAAENGIQSNHLKELERLWERARVLEAEHRRQWLLRFRPGGLEDSVTYLWKAIRALRHSAQ